MGLYEHRREATLLLSGEVEQIGASGGRWRVTGAAGTMLIDQACDFAHHGVALNAVCTWLRDHYANLTLAAVGHRVVQGGVITLNPSA